jgi:RNA polymerase sigma factor (TIGR02999 family)
MVLSARALPMEKLDRRSQQPTSGYRGMNEVTQILNAIEQGDPQAAEQLLPLVYQELRTLAAQRMAQERPGQTLQATALVHEAYLKLLGTSDVRPQWNSRGHFLAAAAEAMRRILIDSARRKRRAKHGGDHQQVDLDQNCSVGDAVSDARSTSGGAS